MGTGILPFHGFGQVPSAVLPALVLGETMSWIFLLSTLAVVCLFLWYVQSPPSFHHWGARMIRHLPHHARA